MQQVRADIIYESTQLTERTTIPGIWSDPIYIDVSSLQASLSTDGGESDVPAFAYYILGLLIAILIIAVCTLCYKMRDRLYDKGHVSTKCLNHKIIMFL